MSIARAFLVLLLAACPPAWAQTTASPLNLQVPADAVSANSKPAAESKPKSEAPASTTPATPNVTAMPAPYDQTYGARRDAAERGCDDATYAQPQIHGSVGMGVVAGSHVSGNYETATLNASKALGSCTDPKGGVGASITVSKGTFNSRRGSRP